jgi:predicted metal-dependent HD superfamily phosphohydrolase
MERFVKLWEKCTHLAKGEYSEKIWQIIQSHYSEPHRFYHTLSHIELCIEQMDLVRSMLEQPEQVEMALWFHDIIYQPDNSNNEAESAEFYKNLASNKSDDEFIKAVVDLILVTRHTDSKLNHDQQYMCDIDMAAFGKEWPVFLEDSENLQKEFPGTYDEFIHGKRKFLNNLLLQPRIFYTEYFYNKYENIARDNIGNILAMMD